MHWSGQGVVAFPIAGLSLAALVLVGTAATAQTSAPAITDAPSLTPGDAWTVRYSDGTRASKKFLREDAGILVFEVSQTPQGRGASQSLLHLTRDLSTVRLLDAAGMELQRFDPHSLGLQFPLTVGKVWQGTSQRFDAGKDAGTFVGTYKVTGIETVTVPAGTFRAFRVEGQTYEIRAPTKPWRFVHWYAPDVRMEVKLQATEPDGRVTEVELVEFRPAPVVLIEGLEDDIGPGVSADPFERPCSHGIQPELVAEQIAQINRRTPVENELLLRRK